MKSPNKYTNPGAWYETGWCGSCFGDRLITAYIVNILNYIGIPTRFRCPQRIRKLTNVTKHYPDWKQFDDKRKVFTKITSLKYNVKSNIVHDRLDAFLTKSKIWTTSARTILRDIGSEKIRELHPVADVEIDNNIQPYDVCLVTQTGDFTPYRNWPYFDDLKAILTKNNITYIDLSAEKILGQDFLRHVKNCKAYVGLETGASHYAAPFCRHKGIIIQSGYVPYRYWAPYYDFTCLDRDMECSPCMLRSGCGYDHGCMKDTLPEQVLDSIQEIIK